MNETFRQHVEQLEPKFRKLLSASPYQFGSLPQGIFISGVYLFSEGEAHLYVGRSKDIRKRLNNHCCRDYTRASFAFLLARLETGFKATYTKKGSKAEIRKLPEFQDAFARATERIRRMDFRFVEESDPIRQALLEIYAAISLDTPYNKFDTT